MKKVYLTTLLLGIFILTATAQSDTSEIEYTDSVHITFNEWRDSAFGQLDKTPIASGYLLEYSLMPFDSLRWNGLGTDNDTIYKASEWFLLYNILQSSAVNANADLGDVDNLYGQAEDIYTSDQQVPLLFLYHDFQRIRKTALNENLLSLASDSVQILDVPGRSRSPYNTYQIFTFSPFKTDINQFGAITFSAPSALWNMNGITSVQVDFDDGFGYRTLTSGATVNIYYEGEGDKILTAKTSTPQGYRYARCILHYSRPEYFYSPDYTWDIEVPSVIGGGSFPSENMSPNGIQTVGANVEVVNGCDQVFNKPIIIVEGFDPSNSISADSLQELFRSVYFEAYLQSLGYDFVFVDFKNNTTYIENNAKVLEAVINQVNQAKSGSNELNIIGYSMGGLIVRYCLADMEDRGLSHHVANFFSYDAPQQGANIPLGLQFLFLDLQNDLSYVKWFDENFRALGKAFASPAAREMLVKRAEYGPFNFISVNDALRSSFAQKLLNKGYPSQCNNYALSFGRGDGIGNGTDFGYSSGDKILDEGIFTLLVNFQAKVYAEQEDNVKDYILRYRFEGLKLGRIFGINIVPIVALKVRNIKYRGIYPYDVAPGGNYYTQFEFADVINSSGFLSFVGHANTYGHYAHCFVPTVSALDLKNQGYGSANGYLSNNMYYNVDSHISNIGAVNGNTISSTLSPFQAVITSTSNGYLGGNLQHVSPLNQEFGDFMIRKITGANPSFNCLVNSFCNRNLSISGPDIVCTNGTYTISDVPAGVNINWSFSNSNLKITNGQGTNEISVDVMGAGDVNITATLTSPCDAVLNISKSIHTGGYSSSDYPVYGTSSACSYQTVSFYTNQLEGATNYQWFWPSGWSYQYGQGTYSITLTTGSSGGMVGVRVANACDAGGSPGLKYVNINCFAPSYAVSPNPARHTITIIANQQSTKVVKGYLSTSDKKNINAIQSVKIYDASGKLQMQQTFSEDRTQVQIDVSKLSPGFYIVKISDGKFIEQQKLVIQ